MVMGSVRRCGLALVALSSTVVCVPIVHGAEPYLVKDIRPGPERSDVSNLVVRDDEAYFLANDGTTGYELWVSDGREAGTRLVLDLIPGPADSDFFMIVDVGGSLFLVRFVTPGTELWKSDGTAGGTELVTPLDGLFVSIFRSRCRGRTYSTRNLGDPKPGERKNSLQ